ncbi:molecular chaperone [Pseudomonas sp. WHRI 8519]|uniref:fimbrial biogenesis chaperone n=1 Tax=Pseudomonas sp. WHRI 8519 TaxID=3162567 RepID=UPI0032EBF58B
MPTLKPCLAAIITLALYLSPAAAQAALTISTTRIVLPSNKQSSTVVVANPSKSTYAVQAWVNTEQDDTTTAVPLVASPALFRLDPGSQQTVQINNLPNQLPEDRESLFFFNAQEIPQQSDEDAAQNSLTIALRTRIKLFYRPAALSGKPEQQLADLKWSLQTDQGTTYVVVDNPTAFHYTFGRLELTVAGQTERLEAREMVAPMSRQRYAVASHKVNSPASLLFTTINDFGGATPEITQALTPVDALER